MTICTVKTPKINDPGNTAADQKDPPILRNPILDGINASVAALRVGTGSLQVPLGSTGKADYGSTTGGGSYSSAPSGTGSTAYGGASGGSTGSPYSPGRTPIYQKRVPYQ